MYILHKCIKCSKIEYCTFAEEQKDRSTQVENINVNANPTLPPQYFKFSQDNGDNQGVSLTNILQFFMHISCHIKKTNALKTRFFSLCFLLFI